MKEKKKTWKTDLKKEMIMIKLIRGTMSHDRDTCDCEGCHCWALASVVFQNARFFEVIRDWKNYERDEYIRAHQRMIQYRMDKKLPVKKLIKWLEEKGVPPAQAKEQATRMLEPLYIVMYRLPPMGLRKEI